MKQRAKHHHVYAPHSSADVLASFGRIFIARRTKLGLSREDAAHETRIPSRWICLLEEGNVAGFGSITYARSFIRAYGTFLGVDPAACLKALPEKGALGGECDYRYLTRSQGAWLRERDGPTRDSVPVQTVPGLRHIKSPIPAGLTVFVLMLATTAIWAVHLAEIQTPTKTTAVKPVLETIAANKAVGVAKSEYGLLSEK